MIQACGGQLRVGGFGTPFALDHGAVLAMGAARSVNLALLSDVLPACEAAILSGRDDDDPEPEEE